MIYRSNLTCPDLTPHFKHIWTRTQPQSLGHDVISDWGDGNAADDPTGYYRETGFWTHDEAAILFNCAKQYEGFWLDIGAHAGWTAAHAAEAGLDVVAVDPLFQFKSFYKRFASNASSWEIYEAWPDSSDEFFMKHAYHNFAGVVIDGEHGWGQPLRDAMNAEQVLTASGVVLFHDFIGGPVQQGVVFLIERGFKCRIYNTPFMVAACWRGEFVPPDHTPDPAITPMRKRVPEFPWERTV